MQAYSDPKRADDPHELPDVEVFHRTEKANRADDWLDDDGMLMLAGWYWWSCFPGCLPDSDPNGPFDTEKQALRDARESIRG